MKKNRWLAIVLSLCLLFSCVNVAVAEEYVSDLVASIANTDGNILFDIDENAVLELDATGITGVSEPMYAKVGIITAAGDLISNELVDFGEEASASYVIPVVPEYGIYDIEIDLYGKDSGRYYGKLTSEFSVVNGPEEGVLNPVHGVCVHYREGQDNGTFGDSLITSELAAKAGFSSARGEVTWEKYATYDQGGTPSYELKDRQADIIGNADNLGMGVLEILSYDHQKYPMANNYGGYNTNMTAPFTAYSKSLIETILSINSGAEFEIWNEWNNEGSWFNENSLSPQAYAKLAKAVYQAVGGEATLWGMSTLGVDTEWIEEVLEEWDYDGYFWQNKNENQQLYMDGISVHPYANWSQPEGSAYINTPSWTAEDPVYRGPIEETEELKTMLSGRGIGETPLRATEWGWVSTGAKAYQNNSSTDSSQIFVGYYPDRNMQAAYFVRMAALSEANDLFDKMDYYQINSKNGADDSDYGLLLSATSSVPYGAKPAYLAAANYNRLMTGATPAANPVIKSGDVYAACFTLADGSDCAILWSAELNKDRTKPENVAKNVTLSVGDTGVTICDMLGNEVAATSQDGGYNLKVDGEPIYVIGDFAGTSLAAATSGSMMDDFYYNAVSDAIIVNADGSDVSAALMQGGEVKQELELTVSANKVAEAVEVDASLEAGTYTLEVVADGTTYTKEVTIPERAGEEAVETPVSSFEPGMIALYSASTRTVKVMGKLTDRSADEPILVLVAKAPGEGKEIAETDIAYAKVFDDSTEEFEFTFTLPAGSYGDYVVRAGAMYADNAAESGLLNSDEAVVCSFTASAEGNTLSATATFANYSEEATKPVAIVIVQYGPNNRLEKVTVERYDIPNEGGVTGPLSASEELDSDTIMCKAFIWNTTGEMVPLVGSITIPDIK